MEDAHLATIYQQERGEAGIYGVFDGHGGREVAKFCREHLAAELIGLDSFQQGRIGEALIQVFHRMDEMLRLPETTAELDRHRGNGGRAPAPPPAPQPAAPKSQEPSSADTDGNDNANEQQQPADVVKRIMEIRRMVTQGGTANASDDDKPQDGQSGSGSTQPPQHSDTGAPAEDPAPDAKASAGGGDATDQCGQVGCTSVVAVLQGSELYIANAGDSRAVLGRGKLAVPLSEDHKPASANERSRITNAGGFVSEVGGVTRVNGNLNLSRAIGDLRYKGNHDVARDAQIITAEPDVRRVTIMPEDRFFLLACDGIWDVLSNQQAIDFVNDRMDRGVSHGDICEQMLDHCLALDPKEARGIGCDNMTAQLVVFTDKLQSKDPSSPH